jgi:hypothetical protein
MIAFETTAEHSGTDATCAKLATEADKLLDSLGRRQKPLDVPTRFE